MTQLAALFGPIPRFALATLMICATVVSTTDAFAADAPVSTASDADASPTSPLDSAKTIRVFLESLVAPQSGVIPDHRLADDLSFRTN